MVTPVYAYVSHTWEIYSGIKPGKTMANTVYEIPTVVYMTGSICSGLMQNSVNITTT